MSEIKKVALAGATGNLGPHILEELVKAGFEVTVLSRKGSTNSPPAGIKSVQVDFESPDTLVTAVTGQDAVVSTMNPTGFEGQKALVEACIVAGVKRYIPSDYGMDLQVPSVRKLPIYGYKVKMLEYLESRADAGLTYTPINNGGFVEMNIDNGFWIDPQNKRINLYDGDKLFGGTTFSGVGRAVVGVLKHPEETKNRPVKVQNLVTSQNKLIALTKEIDPSFEYEVTKQDIDEIEAKSWAAIKGGDTSIGTLLQFLKVGTWGKDCPGMFSETDNELLGIKELSEKEIREIIAKRMK